MKTGYTVHDCMTTKPVSVTTQTSIQECAKTMKNNHVGALVVKDGGKALGILTEQDIVRKAIAQGKNPLSMKVSELMEHQGKQLITIAPGDDIYDALITMRDYNIRHLPVIDNGSMIGLLTLKDILKIEPQLFELIVEKFEIKEAGRKMPQKPVPTEGICEACGEYAEKIKTVRNSLLCSACAAEQA
ncbi:CBS domain-containing protein [Candidatus Woesearchaeota archaeon]|nr:CBS domain-containing protein [Candidatus Woesearchaeota archaeon]MBI2130683.1 CBS domain-containing protein [Candidatus Woesearchaeota archaeon]MBI2660878.1 CBS domain-containing protein [Candidatus Woesearchaeota archaeon]